MPNPLGTTVIHAGAPLENAAAAIILVHGRGATAESIMGLARALDDGANRIAWAAPQAPGNTWYPLPFMQPRLLLPDEAADRIEPDGPLQVLGRLLQPLGRRRFALFSLGQQARHGGEHTGTGFAFARHQRNVRSSCNDLLNHSPVLLLDSHPSGDRKATRVQAKLM